MLDLCFTSLGDVADSAKARLRGDFADETLWTRPLMKPMDDLMRRRFCSGTGDVAEVLNRGDVTAGAAVFKLW